MEQNGNKVEQVTEPMNVLNVRYYCPLTMWVWESDDLGDYDWYGYGGTYARQYEEDIRKALERDHSFGGFEEKTMATYQDNPKIRSVRFDVEDVQGTLYGCIRVGLTAPLTASEEREFRDWLDFQCSWWGFDATYEMLEFDTDDGTSYLSFLNSDEPWYIHNYDYWFMKSESEFRQYLNQNNTMQMGGM